MSQPVRHEMLFPVVLVFGAIMLMAFPLVPAGPQGSSLLGLPAVVPPEDNPTTPAKVALGRKLFFDKRLSKDNSIACATCHDPSYGFADPHAVSIGVKGRHGERNSPTVLNIAFVSPLMWDGRATTLEEQSLLPFESPVELDLPPEEAAIKLQRQGYSGLFQQVFGEDVTPGNLAKALAAYQRTLLAGDSPFDRYLFRKDTKAISPEARRGFDVFMAAKCDACHLIMTEGLHPFALKHVEFMDGKFHNLGVDAAKGNPDPGLYAVTGNPEDWGRFRTPTLRNVALTAPYFHDGSAATLADVIEFYDRGGNPNRNLDPALRPLKLSVQEKRDLVRFLESLTASSITELSQETESPEKE
jgi:cytochrome c peroxidase